MKQNIHNIERIIRVIIGLALISLVFVGPQTPWGWIGIVPLLTGLAGRCPAYSIFGLKTCSTTESKSIPSSPLVTECGS